MGRTALMIWPLLRGLIVAALVATVLALGLLYWLFSRSLPTYDAVTPAPGAAAEIEIVRDFRATPHIFARSDADVFYGLGYAHAQDRLWQMELRRRAAQGRLTELFGGVGDWMEMRGALLRLDITLRAIDLYGAAEASLDDLSAESRAALEAYAAGVNARLAEVDDGALGAGAPELLALGAEVAPWRAVDSVAALKLLAATLSPAVFDELRVARLQIALGRERAADLAPVDAGPAITDLPPYRPLAADPGADPAAGAELRLAERDPAAAEALDRLGRWAVRAGLAPAPTTGDMGRFTGASNVWAVAGGRSATRAPLLASDPHLALSAPSIWYAARLEFPSGGVIGGSMPGVPAILIGRNESFAWGLATLPLDAADFYIEQIDPEDPNRYRTPTGWAAFETREETIPLGDGSGVNVTFRRSRHGPILPLDWPALAQVTPRGHAPALAWTVLDEDDRTMDAVLGLMRAPDVDAAIAVADLVTAPAQNVVMADRRRVALVSVGKAPLRGPRHATFGRAPAPGWRAENDWEGYIAAGGLPRVIAPTGGAVVNANNKVSDAAYPEHLTFDWPAPYRAIRLQKLLGAREFHTLRGFQALQNDTVSEMARAVLPLMAAALWEGRETEIGLRATALERLAQWNGDMDAFLAEPLIFSAWARAATRALAEDELADAFGEPLGAEPLFLERVLRNIDGAAARWCDDSRTPRRESCDDILSLSLDTALAELTETYGPDIATWRWGRAHQAQHRHLPFGDAPMLGLLLNIRQETGGGDHTVRRGRFTGQGEQPYANVHAGGFRAVFDLADLDRSQFALSTGQSGHFLSRHYDDMTEMWSVGDYAPLSLARADAMAGSVGVTLLRPPGADGAAE